MSRLLGYTMSCTFRALVIYCLVQQFGLLGTAHAQVAGRISVSRPVTPLRVAVDLKKLEIKQLPPMVTIPEGEPLITGTPAPESPVPDPVIQIREGVADQGVPTLTAPIVNVPGLSSNANPPDTVGDVGLNHYVQMVNATFFRVWDKQGVPLTGILTFGNLWPVGQTCRSSTGDPIVVYDHLADRWLLSQIANPQFMCIAISQTPDPTAGSWFLYQFDMGEFPDYPKFGVWRDAYYMSSYLGTSLGVYAFDRPKMLLGQAATFAMSSIPALGTATVRDTRILPADLDGPAPPVGTPGFFFRSVDSRQDPSFPVDRIEIYEFAVNFTNNTHTFTLADTLNPAPFNTMACNRTRAGIRDCVPEPATTGTVDALSNRPMMQLRFRSRFGGESFSMVVNQTIDVRGSMPFPTPDLDVAGIRWYELQRPGFPGAWSIAQQGTYAPQPPGITKGNQLLHRWMGSAAMDKFGNIALGFSVDNDDNANPIFPGIRYVGHDVNDPPGVMGTEMVILNGTNSQTQGAGARWGDYSTMSVDPADDCTFWFTTHVAAPGGSGPRPTQIASFRFTNCVNSALPR